MLHANGEGGAVTTSEDPPKPVGHMRPPLPGHTRSVEDAFFFLQHKGADVELVQSNHGWWLRERGTGAIFICAADGGVWRVVPTASLEARVAELEDTIDWRTAWEEWGTYKEGTPERERVDATIARITERRGADWKGAR